MILSRPRSALLLVSWLLVYRPRALAALPSFPGRDPGGALRSGFGWGVLAWLGSTIVLAAVAWVLEQLGRPPEPEAAERAIAMLDPWLVVVAIVILAPIAEEVFFRGVVFNAWLREGGRRWAFIGSAALFAAIHLSLRRVAADLPPRPGAGLGLPAQRQPARADRDARDGQRHLGGPGAAGPLRDRPSAGLTPGPISRR